MLRLWAASADYHADVRCSDDIFKQLSQNYLKFRNTARYCLGNLDGFDPNHLVAPEDMLELDRWAVTQLNDLIDKCCQALRRLRVPCRLPTPSTTSAWWSCPTSIWTSSRTGCTATRRDGLERRSAQTALYLILDTMTKIMAPILCFTCDEIWLAMPHQRG